MEIKEIIKNNNIIAKKKFGQNFLIDKNILNKIVDASNIDNLNVIEIGPGLGSLTNLLVQKAKKLVCYEIDVDMVNILNDNYNSYNNIEIIHEDFLKLDLNKEIDNHFNGEDVVVVSNLPYYITTAILTKILEETKKIKKIIVMVQKEVALRLTGKPSTKDYNSLSVLIQYYTISNLLFNVSPKCFVPAPEVESSVVSLELKDELPFLLNEDFFLKFNRNIFSQRRKTLYNNIKSNYNLSKELIEQLILSNNLSLTVRAESLSVDEIIKLSDCLYNTINK